MQAIITQTDLRTAIVELEMRQAAEAILLKEQALQTYENIKPINLIRNLFKESSESDELKGDLLNSSIGLSAGYLSKVVFQGASGSPIRKILGTAIMFGIKRLVARNPETIKTLGRGFVKLVRNLLKEKDQKSSENKTWVNDVP